MVTKDLRYFWELFGIENAVKELETKKEAKKKKQGIHDGRKCIVKISIADIYIEQSWADCLGKGRQVRRLEGI